MSDNIGDIHNTDGLCVATDGSFGVGKSIFIVAIKKMEAIGYTVYTTKEPTDT